MSRLPTADERDGVLILVENLPVPFDRRVWQEACSLRDAGYSVTVICPRTPAYPSIDEDVEGVRILRYRPWIEARTPAGYAIEYGIALLSMQRLAYRVMRNRTTKVIAACNPPDLLFLVALPWVLRRRAVFVFDHHDVGPELMMAKGQDPKGLLVSVARWLERLTFRFAAVSIATNDSYRRIAIDRGGMAPEDVFVVRSGPKRPQFAAARPDRTVKRGYRHLVAYVGVMGVQEGIDYLLEAARILVHEQGRSDVGFVLAGDGPERKRLLRQRDKLRLDDVVEFPGRIADRELLTLLATADVCVNPDEYNAMNDISTMNKVLEYMSVGKPIVQFDVTEGAVSAGDASLYAAPNDARALATEIARLLDDPIRRERMGALGRDRIESTLSWERQTPALLAAYERALSRLPSQSSRPSNTCAATVARLRRSRAVQQGRLSVARGVSQREEVDRMSVESAPRVGK